MTDCLQLAVSIIVSKNIMNWRQKNFTLEVFFLCGHIITAKLKQTRQVTEVFDISKHWEILLELPFLATGVALRNLRQKIKVYWGQSQICKEIFCCNELAYMAEEHSVFRPAAFRAEFLCWASIHCCHQLLWHREAVHTGLAVFPPTFSQLFSEEDFTAWKRSDSMSDDSNIYRYTLNTLWAQENYKRYTLTHSHHQPPHKKTPENPLWKCNKCCNVFLPSLQKKQSLLFIFSSSVVIFSVLQYSHRDITELTLLNSLEHFTLQTKTNLPCRQSWENWETILYTPADIKNMT